MSIQVQKEISLQISINTGTRSRYVLRQFLKDERRDFINFKLRFNSPLFTMNVGGFSAWIYLLLGLIMNRSWINSETPVLPVSFLWQFNPIDFYCAASKSINSLRFGVGFIILKIVTFQMILIVWWVHKYLYSSIIT